MENKNSNNNLSKIHPTEEQKNRMMNNILHMAQSQETQNPSFAMHRFKPLPTFVLIMLLCIVTAFATYLAYDYEVFQRYFGEDLSGLEDYLVTDVGQGENEHFRLVVRSMLADESFGVLTLSVEALTEESQAWLQQNSELDFSIVRQANATESFGGSSGFSEPNEISVDDAAANTRYYEVRFQTSISAKDDADLSDTYLSVSLNLFNSPFSEPVDPEVEIIEAEGESVSTSVVSVMSLDVDIPLPKTRSVQYTAVTEDPQKLMVRLSPLGLTISQYYSVSSWDEAQSVTPAVGDTLKVQLEYTDGTVTPYDVFVGSRSFDNRPISEEASSEVVTQGTAFNTSVFFDEPIDHTKVIAIIIDGLRYVI